MSPERELGFESDFPADEIPGAEASAEAKQGIKVLQIVGWFSAGLFLATLGVVLGAELRSRYKFKRRTPYDFYSNAGKRPASEFGVGV